VKRTLLPTAAVICGLAAQAIAAGHYEMVWFRQWDRSENGGNHALQVWVFNELGARMGNVHLLDQNGVDHGWYTSPTGERCEIALFTTGDWGVQCTDASGSTSDISPVVTTAYGGDWGHYSYDVGFVFKQDAASLGIADHALNGVVPTRTNNSDDNPYTRSMVYSHQYWPNYFGATPWALAPSSGTSQSQSFVATNANRILGVFLFPVQPANGSTKWRATIHEGGPDGPVICSKTTPVDYYFAQPLAFSRDQCPCVPGGTYTVTLEPVAPSNCNVYLYPGSNYAGGQYYFEGIANPNADMFGFVWAWDAGVGTLGIVRGVVTNTSGNPLSGATVTLTDESTSQVVDTQQTNSQGRYTMPSVPPGTYALDVQKADYKPGHSAGNVVAADQYTNADMVLLSLFSKADVDRDGDVDLTDFSSFQLCFNGPNRPRSATCATDADYDKDGDVDLVDFSEFQACFNGPNHPPAALCRLF
jgi:5-hydroxyisourate hydrolase-like protein (transthyretin family)